VCLFSCKRHPTPLCIHTFSSSVGQHTTAPCRRQQPILRGAERLLLRLLYFPLLHDGCMGAYVDASFVSRYIICITRHCGAYITRIMRACSTCIRVSCHTSVIRHTRGATCCSSSFANLRLHAAKSKVDYGAGNQMVR
jgi:hypothetical protein